MSYPEPYQNKNSLSPLKRMGLKIGGGVAAVAVVLMIIPMWVIILVALIVVGGFVLDAALDD